MNGQPCAMVPTFIGFVDSDIDSLILFEACRKGILPYAIRRPTKPERASFIQSGSVFIYDETVSGIKRRTDGLTWSPSRGLKRFLLYREIDQQFAGYEALRVVTRKHSNSPGGSRTCPGAGTDSAAETYGQLDWLGSVNDSANNTSDPYASRTTVQEIDLDRSLVGSLVHDNRIKPDGLMKKTRSLNLAGRSYLILQGARRQKQCTIASDKGPSTSKHRYGSARALQSCDRGGTGWRGALLAAKSAWHHIHPRRRRGAANGSSPARVRTMPVYLYRPIDTEL